MSTNTFLEFNRDLFLCNTIHDPQNLSDVVPVKMSDGSLFKRTTITDPRDNVYLLPPNLLDHPDYKNGYFPDNLQIYDITINVNDLGSNPIINSMKKWAYSSNNTNLLQTLVNKRTYQEFANEIDKDILPGTYDIWIGSGYIDISYNLIPKPSSNSAGTADSRRTTVTNSFSFNTDPIIAQNMMNQTNTIQKLENDIQFLINFLRDKTNLPQKINEAQDTLNNLRSQLASYSNQDIISLNQQTTTSGSEGTSGEVIDNDKARIVYTVKGGHLVRYDPGFVGECKDYNLKTICPTDDAQKQENCEICKNFQYRDWYDQNNPTQINLNARYDDSTSEYQHMWLQTWNLGIGIIALAYGIYYQLS